MNIEELTRLTAAMTKGRMTYGAERICFKRLDEEYEPLAQRWSYHENWMNDAAAIVAIVNAWPEIREELLAAAREREELKAKLVLVGAILLGSACDLRKLQDIEGVLLGVFQSEYFTKTGMP